MIGCTRMYNVNAHVERLWRQLIERVAQRADVGIEVIPHAAPAPLADLWARPDMVCVFMCGWPYRRRHESLRIVAAPVPRDGPCDGASYRTDFVVDAGSSHHTLEDTFGGRIAWTDMASHSGFNAPRKFLLRLRAGREKLYRESVGPVVTPRQSLSSVLDGRADVAPLDSYFHALLRRHEPELASRLRVVAGTDCAPIPPLVASRHIPGDVVRRLGEAFVAASSQDDLRPVLDDLCLDGFVTVSDPDVYALTEQWDSEAREASYLMPS